MQRLKGVTWKHYRGVAPMLATADHFCVRHPGFSIDWEARSLEEFGDSSVEELAARYDLVVVDHPFVGQMARQGCFLPLDDYIPENQLRNLAASTAGLSHQSYFFAGKQWALAIDAACQVAGFRADLMEQVGTSLPRTWEEVFELAKNRRGFVSVPLSPINALICFFSLCASYGEPPFESAEKVVSKNIGEYALRTLHTLAENSIDGALLANPIAMLDRMSSTDDIAYCPLAFGYSNYARAGYRRSLISFGAVPSSGNRRPAASTLGGAGLAVSKRCAHKEIAASYALWVASEECQRTIYVQSGGQPAHRTAWTDPGANRLTNDFFTSTLPTLEAAWMRPRFAGFVEFQSGAAEVIAGFLAEEESLGRSLESLNALYIGWSGTGSHMRGVKSST